MSGFMQSCKYKQVDGILALGSLSGRRMAFPFSSVLED